MSAQAVVAEGLGKRYRLGTHLGGYGRLTESLSHAVRAPFHRMRHGRSEAGGELWALRDISLEVSEGEVLGVIGRNGAGKTTLLKILSRITEPTTGRAELWGRVGSLLEVGTGFHPELTGRENVFLNGAILGMRKTEIERRFDEIIAFAELERFVDTPVKRYSSGMYVRLAFAVAAYLEPEILFVDEVLSVGDQAFQQRCLGRIDEIAHSGRTVLFVSHNLAAVSSLCTRAVLFEEGRIVLDGSVEDVLECYISRMQRSGGASLRGVRERFGNGRLRFTELEICGIGGPVRLGDDLEVALGYEGEEPLSNVLVSISVEGPLGESLFLCSNKVTGQPLTGLPAVGVITCTIPRLPLAPGRYTVNVYSEVNGVLADWVRGAQMFEVAETDFFGSGRLPPTTHGRFILEHSWSVQDRVLSGIDV